MVERRRMTEDELHQHIQDAVQNAYLYERDELTIDNAKAIDYFNGIMLDIKAEEGRSQAVSKDIADTISYLMPQIMRVFTSSDKLAEYYGRTPNDVDAARQATEYVNYLFMEECNGYRVLYNALHDAFLLRNGVIKHWWDDAPDYEVSNYTALSEDQIAQMVSDQDVEVLEYSEAEPEQVEAPDPMTGQPMAMMEPRFDIKVKRKVSNGRLCVEAVPPEEFLIERGARNIDDARFMAHRRRRMRSSLVAEGFPADKVDQIPMFGDWTYREEESARHENRTHDLARSDLLDHASEFVDVFECYAQLDVNGDGVSEWVRVIAGGIAGESVLLDWEEWDDDVPFTPIIPDPVPHRWLGRSVPDNVMDIQQQKTVVVRALLDNIYMHNQPTPILDGSSLGTDESLEAATVFDGTPLLVTGDVRSSASWYQMPFIGDKSLMILDHLDNVREMRTGMSRVAMGLEADALQNQTAEAVRDARGASNQRIEIYARNIAETGLKRLFKALYKLVVQHQDRPRIIRLRGQFVEIDPRPWSAEMDVAVNVGLGTGSRDRDQAALQTMGTYQQNVIQTYGPDNPIASLEQVREAGVMMAETLGLKNYERIIGSEEAIEQWKQAQAERPDPAAAEAQAEAQQKMQEAQLDAQIKQQELQQKAQMRQVELQQDAEMRRAELAQQAELRRAEIAQEMALKREQMQAEIALKREIADAEIKAKRESNAMNAQVKIGGEPG